MTTITIQEDKKIVKKEFVTILEMIDYFTQANEMVVFSKLHPEAITPQRIKDFNEVEKMNKRDFHYIKTIE